MELTQEQNAAIDALLDFEKSGHDFFTLSGVAGTGKTTTLVAYIRRSEKRILITAPTNKAAKVIEEMAREQELKVDCLTLHKALALMLVDDQEDKYAVKSGAEERIADYDVVVVDEASMVGKSLMQQIENAVGAYGAKVVFVGDPLQLPPVKDSESAVFGVEERAELVMVMRQAEDNPIIQLTEWIRGLLKGDRRDRPRLSENGEEGVHVVQGPDFHECMIEAFTSDPKPDDFKAIAWRNARVKEMNSAIRQKLFGDGAGPYEIGERLIAARPVVMHKEVVMYTDFEATVMGVKETTLGSFPKYKAIKLTMNAASFQSVQAVVMHPDSEADWRKDLADLKKRERWKQFHRLNDAFADLRPCYAITAHRSQGSTYGAVFVDVGDIMLNRRKSEALRCLYVAVSRASKNVFMKE